MKKSLGLLVLLVMSTGVQAVSRQSVRLSIRGNVVQGVHQFVNNHGINTTVYGNYTAFEFAAYLGRLKIIKNLSQSYSVPSDQYKKAATLAIQQGHSKTVAFLMKKLPTEKDKKDVLKAAVTASIPSDRIIEMLVKDVHVKVTKDVVKAAKENGNMPAKTLNVIIDHSKKKKNKRTSRIEKVTKKKVF